MRQEESAVEDAARAQWDRLNRGTTEWEQNYPLTRHSREMYAHGVGQGYRATSEWFTSALCLGATYGMLITQVIVSDWFQSIPNIITFPVALMLGIAPWFMASRWQPRLLAHLVTKHGLL